MLSSMVTVSIFALASISDDLPGETVAAVREAAFGAGESIGYPSELLERWRAPGRLPAFDGWAADVFGFEKAARELGEELAGTEDAVALLRSASDAGGFVGEEKQILGRRILRYPDPVLPESLVDPIDSFFACARNNGESWQKAVGRDSNGDASLSRRALRYFGGGADEGTREGLLCDRKGNDLYVARDDELRSPSAQTAEHNVSLAQGCGYAWRTGKDQSSSGGLGILLDQEGDDRYRGAVFAQATGYWFGVGMLFDLAGDDDYEAVYYGQSASAHFALSYLRDVAGNDRYRTTLSQSLGNGRDLSTSVFRDDAGDDHYFAPDRSLGCGDLAGCGLFVDLSGTDEYEFGATTNGGFANYPGEPDDLRRPLPTVGIFLDLGGATDRYGDDRIKNGETWEKKGAFPGMRGIGIDDGAAGR